MYQLVACFKKFSIIVLRRAWLHIPTCECNNVQLIITQVIMIIRLWNICFNSYNLSLRLMHYSYLWLLHIIVSFVCLVGLKEKRRPWKADEKSAVARQLKICFKERRVPRLHECATCKRSEPAPANRSERNIKDYVHNALTALKRKEAKK